MGNDLDNVNRDVQRKNGIRIHCRSIEPTPKIAAELISLLNEWCKLFYGPESCTPCEYENKMDLFLRSHASEEVLEYLNETESKIGRAHV